MRIVSRASDHELPRNVGLLFFSDDPAAWFPDARIDVVEFPDGPAGDVLRERLFRGGLAEQLRGAFGHLEGLTQQRTRKEPDRIRATTVASYPLRALRETLVNAVYHRSHQPDAPDPTKVHLYPDRIEATSYPGPAPGIEPEHLAPGAAAAAVPARNRRIGELLKELDLAEGRLTGLPRIFRAMQQNGSPPPRFDFDRSRTWFRATLPIHPSLARGGATARVSGGGASLTRRFEIQPERTRRRSGFLRPRRRPPRAALSGRPRAWRRSPFSPRSSQRPFRRRAADRRTSRRPRFRHAPKS